MNALVVHVRTLLVVVVSVVDLVVDDNVIGRMPDNIRSHFDFVIHPIVGDIQFPSLIFRH